MRTPCLSPSCQQQGLSTGWHGSTTCPILRRLQTQESLYLELLFSCPVMSNSLQPHGLQHTRHSCSFFKKTIGLYLKTLFLTLQAGSSPKSVKRRKCLSFCVCKIHEARKQPSLSGVTWLVPSSGLQTYS